MKSREEVIEEVEKFIIVNRISFLSGSGRLNQ
jgi:hypothetical protein